MLKKEQLHDYQNNTVQHIKNTPFAGVFLDMGLGKTVSSLTAIRDLILDMDIKSVLVIAPKRVAETVWQEETQNWEHLTDLVCSKIVGTPAQRLLALNKFADVYIMGRDNISWLADVILKSKKKPPFDCLVLDELSSFKNAKSQRFKKLKVLRPFFKRIIGLTGTPTPNGLIDLWPQMYLLDGGERLEKTITAYRNKYFYPGASNGHIVYSYSLKKGADELIQDKISDICISMKAKDYLTLPERFDNYIKMDLGRDVMASYKQFERDNVLAMGDDLGSDISAINAAVLSNKLLQYANGAIYTDDGDVVELHDSKLKELHDIVDSAAGQPILVAYNFKHDKDRIMKYLKDYNPVDIKDDGAIEAWKQGKIKVLLAHPASAGHGLNIQKGGHIMVWFGLTWSLELYQQFNARLDRQGQTHSPIIHHLVANGTIDERVIKVLTDKDKTQESLLKAIKDLQAEYLESFKNKL